MSKVKLSDIVVDPTIQVRGVESYTVSTYAQAMRSGAKFPPLVLEKGTNRLVAGNHRYYAYKTVFTPDDEVTVTLREFADEAEIIRFAAKDNAEHGRPLDVWDKKQIVLRLTALGDTPESVSALLGVPVKRVTEWAGMTVVVVGKRGKSVYRTPQPVKHGLEHMAGQEVSQEAYQSHRDRDYGIPVKNMAAIITRHINDGLIDESDDKTIVNLKALFTALEAFLVEEAVG